MDTAHSSNITEHPFMTARRAAAVAALQHSPQPHTNPMAKAPFLPKDDNGKADALDNFAAKLSGYAATLEVSAADVSSAQADAAWFRYVLGAQKQMQNTAQQWTAYKNLMRDGGSGDTTPPAAPALPAPAPPAVPAGIILRFANSVARIKRHKNFTDAIGADLGVIGADQVIDPTSFKPILNIVMEAGHPTIVWPKGGADSLEVWVDRDGRGFVFLAIDTQPDYTDTAALPSSGASALWRYRAIYRLHDEQVGQWSDVISTTVAA